jgi:hypothetical protein
MRRGFVPPAARRLEVDRAVFRSARAGRASALSNSFGLEGRIEEHHVEAAGGSVASTVRPLPRSHPHASALQLGA